MARAPCDETDDSDLIEEIKQRILVNGSLVARRMTWVAGTGAGPSAFALVQLGSPPELAAHEWIDIRNATVKSGSMCRRCGKLRAENVDQ